ncbi:MAG TPA: hypothetical protein VM537_01645 [Anaerolineae bacterium]|nr:hypothetical protein [Anaerolineae bacterium]
MRNDPKEIERVRRFVAAAVADGWEIAPTYQSEDVSRAARLTKDGFVMQTIMREDEDGRPHAWSRKGTEASISIWGPDGLGVDVPLEYDGDLIRSWTRKCGECGATDVDTKRVAFANRVCNACLPAARKKYEKPGWCD